MPGPLWGPGLFPGPLSGPDLLPGPLWVQVGCWIWGRGPAFPSFLPWDLENFIKISNHNEYFIQLIKILLTYVSASFDPREIIRNSLRNNQI